MKLKLERPKNPNVRKTPVSARVSELEFKKIQEKANKYFGGSVSEFLRYAALMWEHR